MPGILRSRKTVAVLILTPLSLWCIKTFATSGPMQSSEYWLISGRKVMESSFGNQEDLNLVFVLHSSIYTNQFYVLIKNILHYQGKSIREGKECKVEIRTVHNSQCPDLKSKLVKSLHLHILTPSEVKKEIMEYLERPSTMDMKITFYDWSLALSLAQGSENKLSRGNIQTMKMLWPELCDRSVKKVISLDTDLIFNQNVEVLWNEFSRFHAHEMIGGVFEQRDLLRRLPSAGLFPILKTGVNSGVVLLDLEKIRRTNWTLWWRQVQAEMKSSPPGIPYGDQGILNAMLYRRPEIFHEVPCEWNHIPHYSNFKDYCPIAWVIRKPGKSDCLPHLQIRNQSIKLASIVHFAGIEKPEDTLKRPYYGNPNPVKEYRGFSVRDMRNTFLEVYYAYRKIDVSCFS